MSVQKKNSTPKIYRLSASDIGISEELRPHFEAWSNPETFLDPAVIGRSPGVTASTIYKELQRLAGHGDMNTVRARFYAVALYDMRLHWIQDEPCLILKPKDKIKITNVLAGTGPVHNKPPDAWKWVSGYLRAGSKLKAIAEGNGGLGALFVIPGSVLNLTK